VTTTVTASVANVAPVANAGAFQNVVTGQPVNLSGAGSTDANGDVLTYKWAMVSKPADSTATLANATTIAPSFTADKNGTYVLSLQVNDGKVDSSNISYITITAGAANVAPVANAGVAQTVARGATVTLDATGSTDANNDVLLYRWVLTVCCDVFPGLCLFQRLGPGFPAYQSHCNLKSRHALLFHCHYLYLRCPVLAARIAIRAFLLVQCLWLSQQILPCCILLLSLFVDDQPTGAHSCTALLCWIGRLLHMTQIQCGLPLQSQRKVFAVQPQPYLFVPQLAPPSYPHQWLL
jgi:hypothetical protein